MHVHVHGPKGEAKFWLEPAVSLAHNSGLGTQQINAVLRVIQEHEDEIREAWKEHFGS